MKQIIISIILLLSLMMSLFGSDIREYKTIKIKSIPGGNNNGLLGIAVLPEGIKGALSFFVGDDKKYIADSANSRLNVYSLDFKYLYSISNTEENKIGWADRFIVKNKKILFVVHNIGLTLCDIKGNILLHRNKRNLPDEIMHMKNFFFINNEIFFYNNRNEVGMISQSGEVEKEEVLKRLKVLNKKVGKIYGAAEGIKFSEKTQQVIDRLKNDNKYLIIGDRYYSNLYRKHKNYYEQIKEVREKIHKKKSDTQNEYSTKNWIVDPDNYSKFFLGYDNDHNSYWQGEEIAHSKKVVKEIMIIIDKYGEVIDAFYCGQVDKDTNDYYDTKTYPTSGAKIAVAPNGDVWFMVISLKGHDFYKVERQW